MATVGQLTRRDQQRKGCARGLPCRRRLIANMRENEIEASGSRPDSALRIDIVFRKRTRKEVFVTKR
jgi:hypothetical protein